MSKATKIWLITAASLLFVGLITFVIAMSAGGWNFGLLGQKYNTNVYEVSEDFSKIEISGSTEDIVFAPSEDGKCSVVCYEQENIVHSVNVKDGTLTVTEKDSRKWYEHVSFFSFRSQGVKIYLPKATYESLVIKTSTSDVHIPEFLTFDSIDVSLTTGDVKCSALVTELVKIKTSTGRISLSGTSAASINLETSTGDIRLLDVQNADSISLTVSTGDVNLHNVSCKTLTTVGDTGDVEMEGVTVGVNLSITRTTGDVELEACDGGEIYIKTSTGDVEGSLLSDKTFITRTSTGKVRVPEYSIGERCEITTSTGDIEMRVK